MHERWASRLRRETTRGAVLVPRRDKIKCLHDFHLTLIFPVPVGKCNALVIIIMHQALTTLKFKLWNDNILLSLRSDVILKIELFLHEPAKQKHLVQTTLDNITISQIFIYSVNYVLGNYALPW